MSTLQAAQEAANKLAKMPTRKIDHIPGDDGLPVLGNTLEFLRDYPGLVDRMARQYGNVFRSSVMFQRGINLIGPDANEFVLKDTEHNFSSRLAWNPILEKLFTNGLMLRDFSNHRYHRKILQNAFKKKALQTYLEPMNPRLREGISQWPQDKTFEFMHAIKSLLLDTAAEIFFDLEMGPEAKKVNQAFVAAVDASLALFRVRIPGTTWYKGMKGREYLEKFMYRLLPERRQGNGNDFFTQFCQARDENGQLLSDEDVVNHMIFLLFAAHDTTTSTLCSIVYALAKNPEWQQKLREEYATLDTDTIGYDELEKMTKTGWVFNEALRMHPPLPTIPRRAVRDLEFNGYRIPANSLVSVSPRHTHYMEEYWTNPHQFDPERWSDERAEYKKHFYQFIPFGGGHHKCLGLNFAEIQSKVFLFHLLSRYEVSVRPGYKMEYSIVPLALPKKGLHLKIHPLK